MQDLSRALILLNGELKTLQIESISNMVGSNAYRVCFKKNPKKYTYSAEKVVWLSDPEWIMPELCKVYRDGVLQEDIAEILKFAYADTHYWRIKYLSGYEAEYPEGQLHVVTSCLDGQTAKDTFAYLRQVAAINPLGKSKEENGILSHFYEQVDFIDDTTAAACYLNPAKYKVGALRPKTLIYPFGCNASQKKAVTAAFEHQISVVQGPPGTGKTQTILNIIANIVKNGQTVMIVSNNNSATANVREKLEKYGLAFIVAALGSNANKEQFIQNQPVVPQELASWAYPQQESLSLKNRLHDSLRELDKVFSLQNEEAALRLEEQSVALEWKHFCMENGISEDAQTDRRIASKRLISLWLQYQSMADDATGKTDGVLSRCVEKIKHWWRRLVCRYGLKLQNRYNPADPRPLIVELQMLYYLNRRQELAERIAAVRQELSSVDAKELTAALAETSMTLFKHSLYDEYHRQERRVFADVKDLRHNADDLRRQYPVVLSTTFSARSCLFGEKLYDYIIMDEASQVSVETGVLAMTCARNAVIVGDTLQLSNVVTDEDRIKLAGIMKQFSVADGYDCAANSFLQSVCSVVPHVEQTLLREHYRCHPRIINFCNQKFYGGNLIIMTQDKGEQDVLCAYKTVKGNHAVNQYNQREIDVVKEEVLPALTGFDSVGIVTPYNRQVDEFLHQLPQIETATIHKYQGREKDAIIMSVVDNRITPFADDPNMLNVAVSRAKEKFCLVMTGNEQESHGHILDLLDYIHYNNCTITESKVSSIFDYLYEHYTAQRLALLEKHPQVSAYVSENLTYHLINEVIASDGRFACFKVLCHFPLRQIIHDTSLMSEEELKYASHYSTHVDFLVINRVSKKPVLAIETDGYSYHHAATEQHRRDELKDHIFQSYGIPLLRLSTKGSGEREKVWKCLEQVC